jgi:aldehyde:ferredoxin oxidoreductase
MSRGGFAGKVLRVDLTRSHVQSMPLDMSLAQQFGGGLGLAIRLAFERIRPGTEALSPGNPIVLGAGPLVGTSLPATSRVYAVTKFPASNAIGWCGAGGMSFGAQLKFAGYDHLIIEGRAEHPVFLKIMDESVEICDARPLWGKGIGDASEALWREFDRPTGIVAIGPAGENRCSYAMAYVDRISTLGRGGFGAVMGSKNLKAVVVKGTIGISVADAKQYRAISRRLLASIREYPHLKEWQELGLMKSLPAMPPETYRKIKKRRIACVSCPIGDKDMVEIPDGELMGFSACTSSAVNLMNPLIYGFTDYREAIKCVATLDDLGMDMFEFFGVMGFLATLVENKVVSKDQLKAPVILNSLRSMEAWAHIISTREGLGDVLAGGLHAMLEAFGAEAARHAPYMVRGMLPYVGPKGPLPWNLFGTMELGQLLDPRGPHVGSGGSPTYFAKRPLAVFPQHLARMGVPGEAIGRILPGLGKTGADQDLKVGRLLKYSHTWFTILGSLGICARAQINRFYNAGLCAELYQAVTGIPTNVDDLRKRADRAWTLLKMANIREGFSKEDDAPPEKWFGEAGFLHYVKEKPISPHEVIEMVEDYYDEQGWDIHTGIPGFEKLSELDLTGIVQRCD